MTTDAAFVSPSEPVGQATSRRRTKPPKPPRTRRRTFKQFGLALVGLVYLAAVALGTMLVGGVVLHHLMPSRHVDMFAALHNHIVLGVLLGLSVLWLMPPYPWATHPSTESQEPATLAGETEAGDNDVTDLEQSVSGRTLSHRPLGAGGGGTAGSLLNNTDQQHQQ